MIQVFGVDFSLYGLMVGLGILVGGWIASKVAEREEVDPEIVWDGLVWVAVFGVVGARIYHVVDLWGLYSRNLFEIVAVWNGGLGIFGAILGGLAGLVVFMRRAGKARKIGLFKFLDLAAFGMPVGQAIGRWGNFFNQELYGPPTNLPWGIFIEPEFRLSGFEEFSHFHPLFLYEGILNLVLFGVLVWVYKSRKLEVGKGRFFGVYLVGYGVIRFLLEFLRVENWKIGGVATAQIVSVVMVVVGVWLVLRKQDEK